MDFALPPELTAYLAELDAFIEDKIKPLQGADDNERFFDHRVMALLDAVAGMAAAERLHRRHDRFQARERAYGDADHRHHLAPLLFHLAFEKALERGLELEEPRVEHRGGGLGERLNLPPARLYQRYLARRHSDTAVGRACGA